MKIERRYYSTSSKPKARQKLLDKVDMEEFSPFINDMVYFGNNKEKNIMKTVYKKVGNNDAIVDIKVYDRAFDLFTWIKFYNALVHHEGFHTWQNRRDGLDYRDFEYTTFKLTNGIESKISSKQVIHEIEAHNNQMNHISFQSCSSEFKNATMFYKNFYEKLLQENDFSFE